MQSLVPVPVTPAAIDELRPSRGIARPDQADPLGPFDAPLIGLDADGALVVANRPGWRVLERSDTLAVRDGRPLPADPERVMRWRGALQDALVGRWRLLCPKRPEARTILVRPGRDDSAIRILVRLGPDEAARRAVLRAYADAIGLTGQETRVLECLVDGDPPAVIAARHRVSLTTIRTQVRMTVDKAGVRGARGLLARLAWMLQ